MQRSTEDIETGAAERDLLEEALRQFRRTEIAGRHEPSRGAVLSDAVPRLLVFVVAYVAILYGHAPVLIAGAAALAAVSVSLSGSWFHEVIHRNLDAGRLMNAILLRAGSAPFGLSTIYWVDSHVRLHHPHAGDPSRDPDIQFGRFARVHSGQVRSRLHRWQPYYFYPLMCFATLKMLLPKEREMRLRLSLKSRRPLTPWRTYLLDKYLPFGFVWLPVIAMRGSVFAFLAFLVFSVVGGVLAGVVTQVQHNTLLSAKPVSLNQGPLSRQLRVSTDVGRPGRLWWWLSGGTTLHAAHHVVPQLTFLETPAATRRLGSQLAGLGETVPSHRSMTIALRSHRERLLVMAAKDEEPG